MMGVVGPSPILFSVACLQPSSSRQCPVVVCAGLWSCSKVQADAVVKHSTSLGRTSPVIAVARGFLRPLVRPLSGVHTIVSVLALVCCC